MPDLWAERYDSDLKDLFDLQDEVIKKIISSLHITLTYGEDARMLSRYTDSPEAYLKVLEGRSHLWRLNKNDMILACQRYEEAIALDPNYVTASVDLASTHLYNAGYGWSESRETSLETANQLLQKALTINSITNISTRKIMIPFRDKQDEDRSLEALRLAGLK
ncbi:MAG: hypothetical protein WB818_10290 [Desulfobacterales bacterium]